MGSLKPQKPHVAMIPTPGMGHLIPFLQLAKCLVSIHGVQVTLFVPASETSALQTLLSSLHLPGGLTLINLPTLPISDMDTDLPVHLSITVRESLTFIRSSIATSAHPPTVLIVDMFATDAFDVGDAFNMTKYLFFTSNAKVLTFIGYLPRFDQEIAGEFAELTEPIPVPGCKPVRVDDLDDYFRDRKSGGYRFLLHHARRFNEATGILVNTFEDLEPQMFSALKDGKLLEQIPLPPVHAVGPIIRNPAPLSSENECLTWLDKHPPDSVLFVSFGGGGRSLSAEQMVELAMGLELSRQRFLWVVRPPQDKVVISANYVAESGGPNDPNGYLPEEFLRRIKGKGVGMVVGGWAPQVEILGHAAVGGFLSHCGWNSTLESIVHGVPVIAWPLHAEQKMNAVMLTEDLGVAVRVKIASERGGAVMGREEIERMVRLVMEGNQGKALRSRMKQLTDGAVSSVSEGGGGSSYCSLAQLIKKWKL
ncbi:PREDICTED: hydroquinone glucosyltransferase-like [Nelumbo nucifera]|uniref:Glycosyltransferase n=2 Tax=Nelumbo nucifera TaxID=4432 RepID=A0A822YZ34_NELNU|nr:PREDICTED: hydroquinone glucosyltransferase-like [Nelumbo nucifera]DAD36485.1 TPA_asm: hypothetical protein HUJ06_007126 [Nelumbo nucifera]